LLAIELAIEFSLGIDTILLSSPVFPVLKERRWMLVHYISNEHGQVRPIFELTRKTRHDNKAPLVR
jgi:hypothetical protein